MDSHSQFKREVKSALIWFFIPVAGLMSAITTVWNWYVSGAIDVVHLILLIGSVGVVLICGYFIRKTHLQWQAQVQAGTTEIGEVLYVAPMESSSRDVLGVIGAGALVAILIIWRPVVIASILILWLTGIIWWKYLSTFMTERQCIIGTQGVWAVFLGNRTPVLYSAIKQVQIRPIPNDEVWLTLCGPNLPFGRVLLPIPLDQASLNILKDHIPSEQPV